MSTADFFERRKIYHFENVTAAIDDAVAELKNRGATYLRSTVREFVQEVIVEGWKAIPKEQGEPPL